jgi:hypothetical protein
MPFIPVQSTGHSANLRKLVAMAIVEAVQVVEIVKVVRSRLEAAPTMKLLAIGP